MNDVSIDRIGLLAEPVRRSVYAFVATAHAPVDRDAVAAGVGIGRPLAAFHLDRLVAGGLLGVEYHRRSGRTGPGAGRPAKFYRRLADVDVEVTLPPRRYGLAAEILAQGIDETPTPATRARVLEAARARGRELAAEGRDLVDVLTTNGYEPIVATDGGIRLKNCPFHALVADHRELTCSMNLAFVDSIVEALGESTLEASAQPGNGECCVAIVPAAASRDRATSEARGR